MKLLGNMLAGIVVTFVIFGSMIGLFKLILTVTENFGDWAGLFVFIVLFGAFLELMHEDNCSLTDKQN